MANACTTDVVAGELGKKPNGASENDSDRNKKAKKRRGDDKALWHDGSDDSGSDSTDGGWRSDKFKNKGMEIG